MHKRTYFGVIFKKPLTNSRSWIFAPRFSSKRFIVFTLKFRSLIYFELVFVCGVREGSNFSIFLCVYPIFPALLVEEGFLSSIEWPWHPCWKSIDYVREGLFLGSWFCSSLLVYMCTLMPVPHGFDHCSIVVSFKIDKCESSNIVLFHDCFNHSGPLKFPYEFYRLVIFFKNVMTWFCPLSCLYAMLC